MTFRLMRIDSYFLQGSIWVEIDRYEDPIEAMRTAEKLYYKNIGLDTGEIPDLPYQLDLTLFWLPDLLGGYRSYYTMHNRPYTAEYVVLPA